DREDVILTLTTAHLMGTPRSATTEELTQPTLSLDDGHAGAAIGLVLTGGYRPRKSTIEAICRADLFATLVPDDTYTVASEVHDPARTGRCGSRSPGSGGPRPAGASVRSRPGIGRRRVA